MRRIELFVVCFLISTSAALAVEPQPGDYRPTGSAVGKGIKILSNWFQDAALSRTAQKEKDRLQADIEEAINRNPENGVLVKVIIDKHPTTGIKQVRSVRVMGNGGTPRSVLKEYHQKDHLLSGPTEGFVYDKASSGLVWYAKAGGEIRENNVILPFQLEKQVVDEIQAEREFARKKVEEERVRKEKAKQEEEKRKKEAARKAEEKRKAESARKAEAQRHQLEQAHRMAVQAEMARRQAEMARRAAEQAEAARRAAEAAREQPPVIIPTLP